MVLPELRERILDNNKEKPVIHYPSEETLEQMDRRVKFALKFQKPILITYMWGDMVQECIAFSFRLLPGAIECDLESGGRKRIKTAEILDVAIL